MVVMQTQMELLRMNFCGSRVLRNVKEYFFVIFLQLVPWVSGSDESWQIYITCRDPVLDLLHHGALPKCWKIRVCRGNMEKGFCLFCFKM